MIILSRSWISKHEDHPYSIGGTPGFLFLSDKDQYLAHLLGVSRYPVPLHMLFCPTFFCCIPLDEKEVSLHEISQNLFTRTTFFLLDTGIVSVYLHHGIPVDMKYLSG
jgi:hypothetical protein